MFNIEGSELIFLLLVALVILGPEKLPEAIRKFTKGYAEFKKMASGFQGELRDVLDEPMRELRGTADAMREAAKFDIDVTDTKSTSGADRPAVSEIKREAGLNFGSANPKPAPTPRRDTGLNFGSANPRRQTRIARADDTSAATEPTATELISTEPSLAATPADTEPATDATPAVAEDTNE